MPLVLDDDFPAKPERRLTKPDEAILEQEG